MSEADPPLEVNVVNSGHNHEPTTTTDPTPLFSGLIENFPSTGSPAEHSRRHSTQLGSGVVYPIAEVTGETTARNSIGTGRRRSVSTRGIAGTPASAPPTWTALSSSLRRSVSDIRGHTEALNRTPISPPKETPYEEMMERFQIRQLQRTPSNMTIGLDGDFAGTPSAGHTARTPRQEHYLRPRLSARNVSDHVSTTPDLGSRTGSFLNFQLRSSLIGGGHPPLESGTSSAQLTEQYALAHGGLPEPIARKSTWTASFEKTLLHVWRRRLAKAISPYSRISQARFAVILAATVIYVLWFPVELAFPGQHEHAHIETTIGVLLGLDVLVTLRTSYVTETGTMVVSPWSIVWHYLKTRFVMDSLIAVSLLAHVNTNNFGGQWMSFLLGGLNLERLAYITRFVRMIWLIRANQSGIGNNFWAWLLYSRYSHLFRIAGIVVMVICIAHYIACIWTMLLAEGRGFEDTTVSWRDQYSESFYAALLLMQGEGVQTETAAQNLFASLSVVLGSIVLAVVFGHVAILVSNFNANTTSYQRKMEEVFGMTAKLQLPVPLRERIREYYEHLWHEYECLDGEIVQFSKGLSHSLGLEVVLFKYMEVVMHVPFWKDCTPDFQKQLMLHLDVRVYLPNDFIMRQGEVGVEFYMINRGYCELGCDLNRFERVTTTTLAAGRNGFTIGRSNSGITARRRTVAMSGNQMDDGNRQSSYELDAVQRRHYQIGGRGGKGKELLIFRGKAFGDMALLMNYERAADVRAVTHVELCVLSRERFQTVLAKYPEDRHRVVIDMLVSYMQSYEASKSCCPLLELVRKVYSPAAITKACAKAGGHPPLVPPTLTINQAADKIYKAINTEANDSTLKFGVGVNIRDKLVALRERRREKRGQKPQSGATSSAKSTPVNGKSKSRLESAGHLDSGGRTYSERVSDSGSVAQPLQNTIGATEDQEPSQTVAALSLQERLRQMEEREVAILQGLKELQGSFKVLRARQMTTTPVLDRKRAAPGDDSTVGKTSGSARVPLLRRVGSFVAATSGRNLDSKNQGQSAKLSPTRYADKLFSQPTSSLQTLAQSSNRPHPVHRQHQISRARDSFTFTSEIEPHHSVIESSPANHPPSEAVASPNAEGARTLEQQLAPSQPSVEAAPVELNRRMLFQRMASRSLRVLEQAVQPRTDSVPVARAGSQTRRSTFQRTHSQSLRTLTDALGTQPRPRNSLASAQMRVLKRMDSFVSDTSDPVNNKASPTRYADALFRRRSTDSLKEEGWESK
ncbi:hypothetical protein PHYPSEUDO_003220 [Phytophthora pseudosyringae]|uniref:Cyclic nucleotide-binding domain-containing protein n=1 Tax=Phytophthora pseudosyringae TaxID=221518 RepID=A0A8T1VRS1_9STRA|nr:hypothetical protein PHYPSEUDO_003220 [Phytophthora pseudosyringae]